MKIKELILLIFIITFANNLSAQEVLNEYLVTAAQNNPALKAKFNEYLAAIEKIPQVGTLPDPQLTFGYFIQPIETRVGPQKFRLSLAQMFPWFGTLTAKENVVIELAKAKLEAFEETKSKLFYEVKSVYFNLYYISNAIPITKENIDILHSFRKLALIKLESGLTSFVDELRIEMEIADVENQLAYLKDNFNTLNVSFNNLLNVDVTSTVILPDTLWNAVLGMDRLAILDSISLHNHKMQQLEHKVLLFENQEKVAYKMGKPAFSVGIDYMVTGESSNPMIDISETGNDAVLFPKIGISIPLYRKKYNSMIKEAVLNKEAAINDKANTNNLLFTAFEKAYRDIQDGNRRIELYQYQLKLADKALDILMAEYSTDAKNFEEVLRMERKVLSYSLELDKARADKNVAAAFIMYLMGK